MFQTSSLTRLPFTSPFHTEKMPDSIPKLFNFSVQTRSLCTLAVRNLDAYSLDTHGVKRNGMLGRGEDTHERAAYISLALFSLCPARKLGSQSATHQEACAVSGLNISLPSSDASPGIKKSSSHCEKAQRLEIDSGMRGQIGQRPRHMSHFLFSSPNSLVNRVFWGKHKHQGEGCVAGSVKFNFSVMD